MSGVGRFRDKTAGLPFCRGIWLVLVLTTFATGSLAAVESVEIRSRLDPNAIEITGIDVLFLYDEATSARVPATKSAWYGNRGTLTMELGEAFDLVSTFIPRASIRPG